MPELTPEGDILPVAPRDDLDGDAPAPGRASRRRVAPFVALALAVVLGGLFVVLSGADGNRAESAETELMGKPAPRAIGERADGTTFDLARRKGSWVVLNFFDPECVPCVQEHPELVAFSEDDGAATEGVELTTIVNSQVPDEVAGFFADHGGDWPVVYDDDGSISDAFGVAQVPETWIVDPDGLVQYRAIGPVTADGLLAALVRLRTQEGA
jgi:cytochrome c biogenesis protein CcmG, thiol:disulfide interchange protein DsbE